MLDLLDERTYSLLLDIAAALGHKEAILRM